MFQRIAPEQHDTLEGVPEPSENPFLFGHDDAGALVAGMHQAGKLHHALLLTGPRGVGKATFAFHVAYHLLAHPVSTTAAAVLAAPDSASTLFRQMAIGAHPSILHLTRPPNEKTKNFKTVLTVDEVRRVTRFLSMTAHDGSYRVVIVDPADDLNISAANALLKNLEEPPSRTIFLLVAHSEGALLPTIRSRCQVIRMAPLDDASLSSALTATGISSHEDGKADPELLARVGGSVRNAILLGMHGGLEIAKALEGLARQADAPATHRLADIVSARGDDMRFEIFNENALELLASRASKAALAGDLAGARRLADAWHDAQNAITDTDTYNLDRKQHALSMIERLNAAMRM